MSTQMDRLLPVTPSFDITHALSEAAAQRETLTNDDRRVLATMEGNFKAAFDLGCALSPAASIQLESGARTQTRSMAAAALLTDSCTDSLLAPALPCAEPSGASGRLAERRCALGAAVGTDLAPSKEH